jgi:N12 class adenine-specific DNA methylase
MALWDDLNARLGRASGAGASAAGVGGTLYGQLSQLQQMQDQAARPDDLGETGGDRLAQEAAKPYARDADTGMRPESYYSDLQGYLDQRWASEGAGALQSQRRQMREWADANGHQGYADDELHHVLPDYLRASVGNEQAKKKEGEWTKEFTGYLRQKKHDSLFDATVEQVKADPELKGTVKPGSEDFYEEVHRRMIRNRLADERLARGDQSDEATGRQEPHDSFGLDLVNGLARGAYTVTGDPVNFLLAAGTTAEDKIRGVPTGPADGAATDPGGFFRGRLQASQQFRGDLFHSLAPGPSAEANPFGAHGITSMIGEQLPQLAVMMMTGGASAPASVLRGGEAAVARYMLTKEAVTLTHMGLQMSAGSQEELHRLALEKGYDEAMATAISVKGAAVVGAADTILQKFGPFERFVKHVPEGQPALRRIILSAIVQGGTAGSQDAAQLLTNYGLSLSQPERRDLDRLIGAAFSGAIIGAGVEGMHVGQERLGKRRGAANEPAAAPDATTPPGEPPVPQDATQPPPATPGTPPEPPPTRVSDAPDLSNEPTEHLIEQVRLLDKQAHEASDDPKLVADLDLQRWEIQRELETRLDQSEKDNPPGPPPPPPNGSGPGPTPLDVLPSSKRRGPDPLPTDGRSKILKPGEASKHETSEVLETHPVTGEKIRPIDREISDTDPIDRRPTPVEPAQPAHAEPGLERTEPTLQRAADPRAEALALADRLANGGAKTDFDRTGADRLRLMAAWDEQGVRDPAAVGEFIKHYASTPEMLATEIGRGIDRMGRHLIEKMGDESRAKLRDYFKLDNRRGKLPPAIRDLITFDGQGQGGAYEAHAPRSGREQAEQLHRALKAAQRVGSSTEWASLMGSHQFTGEKRHWSDPADERAIRAAVADGMVEAIPRGAYGSFDARNNGDFLTFPAGEIKERDLEKHARRAEGYKEGDPVPVQDFRLTERGKQLLQREGFGEHGPSATTSAPADGQKGGQRATDSSQEGPEQNRRAEEGRQEEAGRVPRNVVDDGSREGTAGRGNPPDEQREGQRKQEQPPLQKRRADRDAERGSDGGVKPSPNGTPPPATAKPPAAGDKLAARLTEAEARMRKMGGESPLARSGADRVRLLNDALTSSRPPTSYHVTEPLEQYARPSSPLPDDLKRVMNDAAAALFDRMDAAGREAAFGEIERYAHNSGSVKDLPPASRDFLLKHFGDREIELGRPEPVTVREALAAEKPAPKLDAKGNKLVKADRMDELKRKIREKLEAKKLPRDDTNLSPLLADMPEAHPRPDRSGRPGSDEHAEELIGLMNEKYGWDMRHTGPQTDADRTAVAIARRFGIKAVVVKGTDLPFRGVVDGNFPDHMLVKSTPSMEGVKEVLGHELIHSMLRTAPDLFAKLIGAVDKAALSERSKKYLDDLREHAKGSMRSQVEKLERDGFKLAEEGLATLAGELATNPKVWAALEGSEPTLWAKVRGFLSRIMGLITGTNDTTDALAQAYRDFAESHGAGREGYTESFLPDASGGPDVEREHDPEILSLGSELALGYVEAGLRKFSDFAKQAVSDLGDGIKPYLKSIYLGAMGLPGAESFHGEMDDPRAVLRMGRADLEGILATDGRDATATSDGTPPRVEPQPADKGRGRPLDSDALPRPAEVAGEERPATTEGAARSGSDGAARPSGGDGVEGTPAGDGPRNEGGVSPRRRARNGDAGDSRPAGSEGAGPPADRAGRDAGEAGRVEEGKKKPARSLPADLNHVIGKEDVLVPTGQKGKARANVEAIKLLKKLEAEGRNPTPDEKKILAQYVGWGGIPQVFDKIRAERHESGRAYDTQTQNWAAEWHTTYSELKHLLTPDEWARAAASTVNAHYTSRDVIEHGLWNVVKRLGIKGGEFLENSAGIGHVIGLAPKELRGKARWNVVELDTLSARFLKKLYPQADVQQGGFEDARFPAGSQDLVIGNFPFAADGPNVKGYPKFSLHNFFFAKSIDLLKPGGFIVAITSDSTLDNPNSGREFRQWAADRGVDLIGAVRLPNTAFAANAGTEVTTDIVILQKRRGPQVSPHAQPWLGTREVPTEHENADKEKVARVNEYYAAHPENVLGTIDNVGTMYRRGQQAVTGPAGEALVERLKTAVKGLPEGIHKTDEEYRPQDMQHAGSAEQGQKEYSYQERDGKLYQVRDGRLQRPEWFDPQASNETEEQRARDFLGLREQVKKLLGMQLDPDAPAESIEGERKKLDKLYDDFVADHGRVNDRRARLVEDDPEFALVAALEYVSSKPVKNAKGEIKVVPVYEKAKILSERTVYPRRPPEHADTPADAVAISENWRGTLDVGYVAKLLGKDEAAARRAIVESGAGFEDPQTNALVGSNEYLSGDVKAKLKAAKEGAATDAKRFERNVTELEKVQPEPLPISKIGLKLGAPWVPGNVVHDFVADLLGVSYAGTFEYLPQTGTWAFRMSPGAESSPRAETLGGGGIPAHELIGETLRNKNAVAYDYIEEDGKKKRVQNKERTIAAQDAQEKIREKFKDWARKSQHAGLLADIYNERFNGHVVRDWAKGAREGTTFDVYPNAATLTNAKGEAVQLRDYQKGAVARGMRESYVLGHFVGSGKTFTFATTAMEWRRLGLARKPLIVTQNATTQQVVEQFKRLYPGANVLAPTKADFEPAGRKKLLSRIAQGDYDAVIIPQSQFNRLDDDPARVAAWINDRKAQLEDAYAERANAEGERSPAVKEIQKAITRLETRLEKIAGRKTDDLLTFEQLGVDGLIVDEAHEYKKLEFHTDLDNVKGLDKTPSERAFSLFMKARYVQERNGGRNVILATGTPITNTLTEAWTMIRFVRPDVLRKWGIENFDDFVNTFAGTRTEYEISDTGQWRPVTRLIKFVNGPELYQLWRSAVDTVRVDDANLPRPGLKGGKPTVVTVPRSPSVGNYMDYLIDRFEAWNRLPGREKREQSAEPLVINGLAKKAALDMRLVDPRLPDDPGSKLNRAVDEAYKRWEAGKANKTTQVVFADLYQSSEEQAARLQDAGGGDVARFNLWKEFKKKLVERGIPAQEIQSIYDHDTDKKKAALFQKVQDGDVRIVVGHTDKLGVGVNIQNRLAALHHLDAPPRPSDVEQREGRILRQGNMHFDMEVPVEILRYGTERTFDAGAFQRLANKARMVTQLMNGEIPREFEEVNTEATASFDEAMADVSGNPIHREKVMTEQTVRRLQTLADEHQQQVIDARRSIDEATSDIPRRDKSAAEAKALHDELSPRFANRDELKVSLGGGEEATGKDAVAKLDEFLKGQMEGMVKYGLENTHARVAGNILRPMVRIKVNGLDIDVQGAIRASNKEGTPTGDPFVSWSTLLAPKNEHYKGYAGGEVTTGNGLYTSIASRVERLESDAKGEAARAVRARQKVDELKSFIDSPFDRADELQRNTARLKEITAKLVEQAAAQQAEREARAKAAEAATQGNPEQPAGEGDVEALGAPAAPATPGPLSDWDLDGAGKSRGPDAGSDALGAKSTVTPHPRLSPAPLPGGTPKKLGQIVLDFTKGIGASALRKARPARNLAGQYFFGSARKVIRYYGDLNTAAHEIAHYLDDRYNLVGAYAGRYKRSPFDAELMPHFSAHGSGGPRSPLWYRRAEGVAEWIRGWMVNPTAAEAAAPKFYTHFVTSVPADVQAHIRSFGDEIRRYAGSSPTERTKANINFPARPESSLREQLHAISSSPSDTATKLKTELTDQYAALHRAHAQALAIRDDVPKLAWRNDPSTVLTLLAGMQGKIEDAIAHGPSKAFDLKARADDVGGGIGWMLEPLKAKPGEDTQAKVGDALAYLVNRRVVYKARQIMADARAEAAKIDPTEPGALQRKGRIMQEAAGRIERLAGTGGGIFSDATQAVASIKELATAPHLNDLEEFAKRYEATARGNLAYLRDTGRISADQYKEIIDRNEIYADMHRLTDGFDNANVRVGGKNLAAAGAPVQKFKGSTMMIENPVVSLMMQTARTIHEADRNYYKQQFTALLDAGRKMYDGPVKELDSIGSRARQGDDSTVRVFRDGKEEHWQFRQDVHEAMKWVAETEHMGPILRAVSLVVKGIPHKLITTAPAFVARQLFKDAVHRSVFSRSGSKPADVFGRVTGDQLAEFRRAGGDQAGLYRGGDDFTRLFNEELRKLSGEKDTILVRMQNLGRWWNDKAAEWGDTRSRLAEYRRAFDKAKKEGSDDYDAALYAAREARDLIDYAVAGRAIRKVAPFVLFLNPAIQGPRRALNGLLEDITKLRSDPAKYGREFHKSVVARWGAYVLIPRLIAAGLRAAFGQDDDYYQLPAWRRDFFLNFKLAGKWISVPQPYELGVLGSAVERTIDAARGKDKHPVEGWAGSLVKALMPVDEMPLGGAFRGLVENVSNYNFFFGRHIVPTWEEDKDVELREGTDHASRIGQALQAILGVDARKADNFLYNVGGGVARMAMDASDVGRGDKRPGRYLDTTVGLTNDGPTYGARDVQWVMDAAKSAGDENSLKIRVLSRLLRAQQQATTDAEKERLGVQVREAAASLRSYYEQNGGALVTQKRGKLDAKKAG